MKSKFINQNNLVNKIKTFNFKYFNLRIKNQFIKTYLDLQLESCV